MHHYRKQAQMLEITPTNQFTFRGRGVFRASMSWGALEQIGIKGLSLSVLMMLAPELTESSYVWYRAKPALTT